MNILITGANGFLADSIISYYRGKENVKVTGITRHKMKSEKNIYYVEADVLEIEQLESILKKDKYDVVIHMAAITAHEEIINNKYESLNLNIAGTQNLLRVFNKYCSDALFIFTSSGKVYGDTDELPISEKAVTRPMNVLGKSKLITEKIVEFYAEKKNKYLITRIFQIYGRNQKENFIVPTIVKQLCEGNRLNLGNLSDERDYLYIEDFVSALVSCINSKSEMENFQIVNIGSGKPVSVHKLIECFENILSRSFYVTSKMEKYRKDEKRIEYCDNTKLRDLTGWDQKYSLEEGIRIVCQEAHLI